MLDSSTHFVASRAAQAHAQSGPSAEAVELVNKFATNIKELHSATGDSNDFLLSTE